MQVVRLRHSLRRDLIVVLPEQLDQICLAEVCFPSLKALSSRFADNIRRLYGLVNFRWFLGYLRNSGAACFELVLFQFVVHLLLQSRKYFWVRVLHLRLGQLLCKKLAKIRRRDRPIRLNSSRKGRRSSLGWFRRLLRFPFRHFRWFLHFLNNHRSGLYYTRCLLL